MRTNGRPGTPQQSGNRTEGEPTGIPERLRALVGATLEWVRGRLGFARPGRRRTDGSDLPRPADTDPPASGTGSEPGAESGTRAADRRWTQGQGQKQGRQWHRKRKREVTPALPGDDLRARERNHQLRIYEPERRGAYIESDTWQEIER